MVDWIGKNVTWIFSGVGVAIIGAILSLLFKRRRTESSKQEQTSGDNSTNVQVGGDVTGNVSVENIQGDKVEGDKTVIHNPGISGEHVKLGDGYREAGRACERRNDHEGAKRYYNLALNINPDDYNALANLAWIEHKDGKTEVAKMLIDKVCKAKPEKDRFQDLRYRIYNGIKSLR